MFVQATRALYIKSIGKYKGITVFGLILAEKLLKM